MSDKITTKAIDKFLEDRVYNAFQTQMTTIITDTKEYTRVLFSGLDLIVHVVTIWHDNDHKYASARYKFPMLYDEMILDIKTFPAKRMDDFLETVQDAAVAASSISNGTFSDIHDDEGFIVLKPREVEMITDSPWGNYMTMPRYVKRIAYRKKMKNLDMENGNVIPGRGWIIHVRNRNIHYELVDALIMLFTCAESNSSISDMYRYMKPLRNDTFEMVNEFINIFAQTMSGMTPESIGDVVSQFDYMTLTAKQSALRRERGTNNYYCEPDEAL